MTVPYWRAILVSHVAPSKIGAGNAVTPWTPSATPAGPSCKHKAGIPSLALLVPLPTQGPGKPCTMAIFSSKVISASNKLDLWSTEREVFIQGLAAQTPCASKTLPTTDCANFLDLLTMCLSIIPYPRCEYF